MMLEPGIEFMILSFSLLKLGAIIVFVDPRMGRTNLATCLADVTPEVFIGSLRAHIARIALNWARDSLRLHISVPRAKIPGCVTFDEVMRLGRVVQAISMPSLGLDEPAAVVFTSGSTGSPKGVIYTHRMFSAQVDFLKDNFRIMSKEVDVITFPLFAFFNPVMRVTSVFPRIDFTRPANADPVTLCRALQSNQATHMFGSPALLDRLSRYGVRQRIKLSTIRRILIAGAPVSTTILGRLYKLIEPAAEIYSCYGATEALPVCFISGRQLLAVTLSNPERGVCLGGVISGVRLEIIEITDDPIPTWNDSLLVKRGEIGELVVSGPNISQSYWGQSSNNEGTKIASSNNMRHHRTGDLGYIDRLGCVWMAGRKSQQVITEAGPIYTLQCERIFDQHPKVFRSALVGIGARPEQKAVLCVELRNRFRATSRKVKDDLLALGQAYSHTRSIDTILFRRNLPVDARHNSKILREKLSIWAARKLS